MTFPQALLQPAGALVAAADLLLLAVLGAWLVRAAAGAAPAPFLAGNPIFVPALLFAAVTAASLAWSTDRPETVKEAVQIVEIVVVFLVLFASMPRSLRTIQRGLVAYVGLTTALAAVTTAVFATHAARGDLSPVYLPGLHKNAIGSFLGVGLVLAFTLSLDRAGSRPRRRALQLAALVGLVGLVGTFSRGALFGAGVAVLVIAALLRRERLRTALLVVLAAALLFGVVQPRVGAQANPFGAGYQSSSVRALSYAGGVEKIKEHPLLGTGAGTYWDDIPELGIGLADPNNLFLLTWAELGLAGLAALLFLLYRYGRSLVRARRLPELARGPALAAGGAALSLFAHFQVDSTWTRGTASICFALVGLMLAATRLAPPEPADDVAGVEAPPLQGEEAVAEPRALRVLQVVTSDGFAGIERHVVRLSRELRARGCACEIACPPWAERLRAEAAAAGIPVVPRADSRRSAWSPGLIELLRADPPEVVHVHDGVAAVVGWQLALGWRSRLVRTQHFVRPASSERTGWRRAASLALHRALNRDVDALIAVSGSVAEATRARGEATGEKLIVIPPGVELPAEEDVTRAVAVRARLRDPVVAFVGRLEPEKSLPLLLAAIPLVLERLPSCRFVIAGSGSLESELRALARRLGLGEAVAWVGEVDEPAPVLEQAHVFVNPSSVEGFGLAVVEAMAYALPVVGMRAGGVAETVEDGRSGTLVDDAEPAGLAEAIVGLAGDRRLAAKMGREALRRAAALYSAERTAQLTLSLYERLRPARR